jgi:hypothetical protein
MSSLKFFNFQTNHKFVKNSSRVTEVLVDLQKKHEKNIFDNSNY